MAYEAKAARRIVAITVPAVTNSEIPAPTGNFVRFHACTNPSKLNGAGREKALPSTAWPLVFSAIEIVTYSGSSTVTAQRIRMMVPDQLTRSIFVRPGLALPGPSTMAAVDAVVTAG